MGLKRQRVRGKGAGGGVAVDKVREVAGGTCLR